VGIEKKAELKLIKAIRSIGFVAWHMDCSVDGFPDILALGNCASFVAEVKQGKVNMKLSSAFEPSQPVWSMLSEQAGYDNIFQVIFDGSLFYLYSIPNLWKEVITDKRFCDFDHIIVSTDALVIAKKMREKSYGK